MAGTFGSGDVSQLDVRSPNMMQLEDAATQILMQLAKDPQGFMNSLGFGSVSNVPDFMSWQGNPFAQRAQQPGIMQMLYGSGAPGLQFGAPPQGWQPGAPGPAWQAPPASLFTGTKYQSPSAPAAIPPGEHRPPKWVQEAYRRQGKDEYGR